MNSESTSDSRTRPGCRIEICILAGGLSTRMGSEKARLRLGPRSLLGHVRAVARSLRRPVRVVRRDLVPRCGPLGGVCTALLTTRAAAVLFLSCDMPFVAPATLRKLLVQASRRTTAVFTECAGTVGFPFVVPRTALPLIQRELVTERRSLQRLARLLSSTRIRPRKDAIVQLLNINTPEDLRNARRIWRDRHVPACQETP